MKKFSICLMLVLLTLAFNPFTSLANGSTDPAPVETTTPPASEEAEVLIARLETIQQMDFSTMTRLEKKSLRKEVRQINKDLKVLSGGVYLSASAIIIILLIAILIL